MFKTVWPQMKERSNKARSAKRCAIIDLSSIASIAPHHQLTVYAATKAFNKILTLGLSSYLSTPAQISTHDIPTEIDFMSVLPYFVDSNMTMNYKKRLIEAKHPDAVFFVPALEHAWQSISQLGRLRITPGHKLHSYEFTRQQLITGLLPEQHHHQVWSSKFPVLDIKNF